MIHGEQRTRTVKVNNGKIAHARREKLCFFHGWIDLFYIGGEIEWQRRHGNCPNKPIGGADEMYYKTAA